MTALRTVLLNVWELLVEDGWIASGTVAALVVTAAWAILNARHDELRNLSGWLLLGLLMLLLLANLFAAGRRAARARLGGAVTRDH